jgi:PTH1 family peptidyl-tRNA hydrolase
MNDDFSTIPLLPPPARGPLLIVGLGNRGKLYAGNRHNVGFMLVSLLAERLRENFNRVELRALVAKAVYQNQRLILAKPQTYMNASGNSVRSLLRFYKIPNENLLVASDDVDLPLETLRIRPTGGSGGQKGVQSIIEQIGTEDFPRLRIGINRPPGRMEAADYVLQDFTKDELVVMKLTLERAVEAVLTFVSDGLDKAMNLYNG